MRFILGCRVVDRICRIKLRLCAMEGSKETYQQEPTAPRRPCYRPLPIYRSWRKSYEYIIVNINGGRWDTEGAHITRLGSAGPGHVLCQRSSDNEIDTEEQQLKAIRRKLEKYNTVAAILRSPMRPRRRPPRLPCPHALVSYPNQDE